MGSRSPPRPPQEAFDHTGRILNIVVSPANHTDPPRLLNYLTAPHVLVWSAALASSSVPLVFAPTALLVREPDGSVRPEAHAKHGAETAAGRRGTLYTDGSVEMVRALHATVCVRRACTARGRRGRRGRPGG